jgi:hypothetical protein
MNRQDTPEGRSGKDPSLKHFLLLILFVTSVTVESSFGRLPETLDHDFSSQWIERDGHTLFLNGQGIHTASIFKIRVYEIFLFLQKRSMDPDEILMSPGRKVIILKFLRNVDADQLRSAFSDGFYENCANRCDQLRVYLDELNLKIPNLREGDTLEFQFLPTKVILRSNLRNYSEINDLNFGRVMLSIWLGSSPPSGGVKENILGLNPLE